VQTIRRGVQHRQQRRRRHRAAGVDQRVARAVMQDMRRSVKQQHGAPQALLLAGSQGILGGQEPP